MGLRAGIAAAALLLVGAAPAAAQAPGQDSVTGDLFDQLAAQGSTIFSIDAHSGPAGESPTGVATWHLGGGLGPTWDTRVTCLAVSGHVAVVGFSGTFSFFAQVSPVAGLVRVVDGGGAASGLDSFEWAESLGPDGGAPIPGPTDCSSYPGTFGPGFPPAVNRTGGDLVVTDARPPLPTSKEQCKHGGWRIYGVFENQGDCVRSVATGAQHPPANSP